MRFLLLFLLMAGCAELPRGQFNHEDLQDPDCYAKYGGMRGYCDQMYSRRHQ